MPEVTNPRQVGRDVESVANLLTQGECPGFSGLLSGTLCSYLAIPYCYFPTASLITVPGFQFAQILRDVIRRARRNKILPPASKPPSPTLGALSHLPSDQISPLPSTLSSIPSASGSADFFGIDGGAAGQTGSGTSAFDFTYAEQLFSDTGRTPGGFGYVSGGVAPTFPLCPSSSMRPIREP